MSVLTGPGLPTRIVLVTIGLLAFAVPSLLGAQELPARKELPKTETAPGLEADSFLGEEELYKQKAEEERGRQKQKIERTKPGKTKAKPTPRRAIPPMTGGDGISSPLQSKLDGDQELDESEREPDSASSVADAELALPELPSTIEEVFFGKFPTEVPKDLRQFGYDIFSTAKATFMPVESAPVAPDYVVGPGDAFTINVWGSANFSYPVTVRSDGTIFIPKVGAIKVWGLSTKKMSQTIKQRLSNYFSGINVNISFESIRTLDVFVVGEVSRPGSYSISSTATPINALFFAGGPTKRGSLRNIEILRNNERIATVDLYDFLISGSHSAQRLQSQDVILVPVIGTVAAVAGHVKRPAIYEIRPGTTVAKLITMAGGLSFTGHIGRVSIDRVMENKERITRDFRMPEDYRRMTEDALAASELGAIIEDGDLVQVFPVLPDVHHTVFLRGHVRRPGSYQFNTGMTLKSLIPSYTALKPEPYTQFVQIVRTLEPKDVKTSLFVDLDGILNGSVADVELESRDEVIVFSKDELELREKVSISGNVNKPGEYYFFPGITLRDLIFMAGNLSQDAYLANAEIARYHIRPDQLETERVQIDLNRVLGPEASENPVLQPKDRVFVRGIPNWVLNNYVELSGEVRYPGRYSFQRGEKLSSVLERASGFTEHAFLPGAVFTRQSVKEIQRKSLLEQVAQLEQAILHESVSGPAHSMSAEEHQSYQESLIARKALLQKLQHSEVSGRMVIHLADLKRLKNSRYDFVLEPEDMLVVPKIPSVVTVMGEVYNPTALVYTRGGTVQHYLNQVGGPTLNADQESIFIVKANGTIISRRQSRGFLLRNFLSTPLEPGDVVLVPKDISRYSWLATTKDITEILFKIASTTGITITALK